MNSHHTRGHGNIESQIKLTYTNRVWINSNHLSSKILQTQTLPMQIYMDVSTKGQIRGFWSIKVPFVYEKFLDHCV